MYHTKSTFFLQWFATFVKRDYSKIKQALFLQSMFNQRNKNISITISQKFLIKKQLRNLFA